MVKKFLFSFLILLAFATILVSNTIDPDVPNNLEVPSALTFPESYRKTEAKISLPELELKNSPASTTPEIIYPKNVLLNIPFTSQAPSANWKDPRQQDSCEEASALMAIKWARGESLSSKQAEKELLAISEWELAKYDNFHDTSAKDTMERIIKSYFSHDKVELLENATLEEIKNEIFQGNALIAPMDGQKLKNPHYTGDGPERHMLIIRGYNIHTKEFITNDPGTRYGEKYLYPETHFYDSIRDYSTGDHSPIKEIKKNIIVVKK